MLESCYCGRTGEIEDREPVVTGDAGRALRCPDCGQLERPDWLPGKAGDTPSRRRRAGNQRWRRRCTSAVCARTDPRDPGHPTDQVEGKSR
jgi:hypothetical protein